MDDLAEIQRRIAQLEAGLAEVKAIVQRTAEQRQVSSAPPLQTRPVQTQPAQAPGVQPPPAGVPPTVPSPPARPRSLLSSLLWSHGEVPTYRKPATSSTPAQQIWQNPAAPRSQAPLHSPAQPAGAGAGGQRPATGRGVPPPTPPSGPPTPPRASSSGEFEANLLGSWFARIGAFAIFLGAAFAFKYAVDRNLITPAGRIAIGIVVGIAFIGWGEWARSKAWPLFAQAVAGGGVAIMYLSVWAGYQLYDLMSAGLALFLLALVVVAGGALAVRHNSMALAVMAALGGFLNPVLVSTGRGSVGALNLYLLFLNAGILGLAFYKAWRGLAVLSMAATWMLIFAGMWGAAESDALIALAFAAVFFVLFHAVLLQPYLEADDSATEEDLLLTSLNSLAFFVFGMFALEDAAEPIFALVAGLVHIGIGLGWRRMRRSDTNAVLTFLGLGIGAATIAVALQFEGPVLATVWAIESVLIMLATVRTELSKLRVAGLAVFALSVGLALFGSGLGAFYDPPRPFFSMEALPFVTQVAALSGTAFLLRRQGDSAPERRAAEAAEVLAIVLAGIWLTFELAAHYVRVDWPMRTLPYAVAAFWASYAAGVGAVGLARGAGWAKPLAVSIFGISVAISVLSTGLGAAYHPERPLVSVESLAFLIQIAVLGAAAAAIRRRAGTISHDPRAADAAAVLANLLALLWLTLELWSHYNRQPAGWNLATFTFTLSTVYTLYAAALLAFGIGFRAKWARLLSVALFGVVILKLVMADVWLLETPLRIASLMGLGLVLLLCSLGYHRFRALILGPDDSPGATTTGTRAA